jgi:hypothetical protein
MRKSPSDKLKCMWAAMTPEEKLRRMAPVTSARPKARVYPHGDENRYCQGCRCLLCRAGAADAKRERGEAKRALLAKKTVARIGTLMDLASRRRA